MLNAYEMYASSARRESIVKHFSEDILQSRTDVISVILA